MEAHVKFTLASGNLDGWHTIHDEQLALLDSTGADLALLQEVTPESLQVGRAHIERRYVGRAEAFRGDAARIAAGPAADGRAYMCFRPWVSPVVRIRIDDPADPTPYWLANARHPEDLVRALGGDPDEQDEHALEYTEPAASPEDNPGWRR